MSEDLSKIKTFERLQQEIKDMIKCANEDYKSGDCEQIKTYQELTGYKKACYTIEGMLSELMKEKE